MSIRIYNNSVSAVVRSYAIAPTDKANVVVWLDLAPQHPKVIGAIWASLVNGTNEELGLRESASEADHSMQVQGLHARYIRLTADAPRLAGRARPRFLRDAELQSALVSVRERLPFPKLEGKKHDQLPNFKPNQEYYLRSPAEVHALYTNLPEAVRSTGRIAERCNVTLPTGLQILP